MCVLFLMMYIQPFGLLLPRAVAFTPNRYA